MSPAENLLSGIRVIDCGTYIAGPAAAAVMSDFGAEVIKIERPPHGDPYRYLSLLPGAPVSEHLYCWILDGRNKKSIALNLEDDSAREALLKLVETADVFITNYQPSLVRKFRLGYEELQRVNGRLIYALVTGFGEEGEDAEKPGYDQTAYWGHSGLMYTMHNADAEPCRSPTGFGDHPVAMTVFGGVMAGLYRRGITGKGMRISTSLMANGAWSNACMIQAAMVGAQFYPRTTRKTVANPLVNHYVTRDGKRFMVCCLDQKKDWSKFCLALGHPEWMDDERFRTPESRRANAPALVTIIDEAAGAKDMAEWAELFRRHEVIWAPVLSNAEAANDPQMEKNGVYAEIAPGMRTVNSPLNISGNEKVKPRMAPEVGEHTLEVLRGIGYSDEAIADLVRRGAAMAGKSKPQPHQGRDASESADSGRGRQGTAKRVSRRGAVSGAEQFDLVVIGCGPTGEKGAAQAAYFGKRVAVVERSAHLGGSGVNTGTLPSKTLRESALYFSGLRQRGLYGIDYSLREGLSMGDFMHRKDVVVEAEREKIRANLATHRIELVRGAAAFEDARTVAVRGTKGETRRMHGEAILIATGSRPHRPPEIAFDDIHVFDSDTFLSMDRIPASLAVVGGGVIGCEYASLFNALGVQVHLVDGKDRLLPFLDVEISRVLRERLTALGMNFYFEERMEKLERTAGGVFLKLKSGKTIEAEKALFAAGRRAAVDGLALDKAGLAVNARGYLDVNAAYQTRVPNIYAAGDVIGFPALASTGMEQGRVAVCHAFGFQYKQRVASMLPMGIYTIPEISAVGETEESCKEKGIAYAVGRGRYANNARGMIAGDTAGMLKLIFRSPDKRLLGVHMIGENATELIHLGAMALEKGDTIDTFIELVFNYPTLSETYKYAAYDGLGNLAGHKLREG